MCLSCLCFSISAPLFVLFWSCVYISVFCSVSFDLYVFDLVLFLCYVCLLCPLLLFIYSLFFLSFYLFFLLRSCFSLFLCNTYMLSTCVVTTYVIPFSTLSTYVVNHGPVEFNTHVLDKFFHFYDMHKPHTYRSLRNTLTAWSWRTPLYTFGDFWFCQSHFQTCGRTSVARKLTHNSLSLERNIL